MRPLSILFWASLLLPAVLVGAVSWQQYVGTLDEAVADGQQTIAILREHALRVFDAQEAAIAWIDSRIAGMSWAEIRQSEEVHELLAQIADQSPHIDGLWLVPPDGRTANSADFFPMPEVAATERDYFRVLRENDVTYLGEMIRGHLKGTLNFNISRRRSSPDNAFDGLILVTITLGYFEKFWSAVLSERPHVVTILRSDGEILARYPGLDTIPKRIPPGSPFFDKIAIQDTGSYQSPDAVSHQERLHSFAKLGRLPAYILVGLDRAAVLASWRKQTAIMFAVAAALSLALAATVQMARRRQERLSREIAQRRAAEASLIARDEHMAALQRSEQALRESEERLREAQEIAGLGRWERDLRTKELRWSNDVFRILGRDPRAGVPTDEELRDLRHPDDRDAYDAGRADLLSVAGVVEGERRYRRPDGSYCWVRSRVRSFADATGRVVRLVGTIIDITDRKAAEQHQKLLIAELDHRVKNVLAIVQSVVWQSLGRTPSAAALTGRLTALASTHSLLSQSKWQGAYLRAILEEELRPYAPYAEDGAPGRVRLTGPAIRLSRTIAQALSLVLHELATNAVKYGALSAPEGYLDVTWRIQAGDETRLQLTWRESGGPPAEPPPHKGFGLKLIEQSLSYQLDGAAHLDFRPEGLQCHLDMAVDSETVETAAEERPSAIPDAGPETRGIAGRRILVVEDMALVAMEIGEVIQEAGGMVVGPTGRLDEALRLGRNEQIDAAVLDLNLNNQMVFPLADVLRQRGVPFVFLTGYGEDAVVVPPAFRGEPRIGKPVQAAKVVAALSKAIAHRSFA